MKKEVQKSRMTLDGGGTPGPRFLMPIVPYLALPLALAYRRFPVTTLALAVPSALFMLTATLTFPLSLVAEKVSGEIRLIPGREMRFGNFTAFAVL